MPRQARSAPLRSCLPSHTPRRAAPDTASGTLLLPSPATQLNPGVIVQFLFLLGLVQPAPSPARSFPQPTRAQIPARERVRLLLLPVLGLPVPLGEVDGEKRQKSRQK